MPSRTCREAVNGHVLLDDDIVFGTWYADKRKFVVDGPVANAVQVTVRRGGQNGNPSPTFFLHIFGYDHADIAACRSPATSSSAIPPMTARAC